MAFDNEIIQKRLAAWRRIPEQVICQQEAEEYLRAPQLYCNLHIRRREAASSSPVKGKCLRARKSRVKGGTREQSARAGILVLSHNTV